jgi:hypothetical protein
MNVARPSSKRDFLRQLAHEAPSEQPRASGRYSCGSCRWCMSNHPYGCPHRADQSQEDAVMALFSE